MKINLAEMQQRWDKAKLTKSATFQIAIGAIILTLYLGFSQGGWTTSGTAQRLAETTAQNAVLERLVPICIVQFNADPDQALKLEELKAVRSSRQRSAYIEEQGWATMPGEAAPDNEVARECVKQIMLFDE